METGHDHEAGQSEAADDDNHPEHAGEGPGLRYEAQAVDGGILQKTCEHTHTWCCTGRSLVFDGNGCLLLLANNTMNLM